MKRSALALLATGLLVLVGCETKSPPGGPGAARTDSKPRVGTPENTFSIQVPSSETIKQGESKTVTVTITRGTNFDQDVKLDIENAPQGVTLKFDNPVLAASAKEVHLTIEASKDAAPGEHYVTVDATPAREGAKTTAEIKIEVKKP